MEKKLISEIEQEENVSEITENAETAEGCHTCTEMYHPDFTVEIAEDNSNFQIGGNQAAYFLGFGGVLNNMGLSEASLVTLIKEKMYQESQMEMLRLQLQSNERIATIMSKTPIRIEED